MTISELILTACLLAVYASHSPVTQRMATLATGLPATALTGLDLHQLDSIERFHYLSIDSPLPRLPSATIQAFASRCADDALGDRVRLRTRNGGPQYLDSQGSDRIIEVLGEDPISI